MKKKRKAKKKIDKVTLAARESWKSDALTLK